MSNEDPLTADARDVTTNDEKWKAIIMAVIYDAPINNQFYNMSS